MGLTSGQGWQGASTGLGPCIVIQWKWLARVQTPATPARAALKKTSSKSPVVKTCQHVLPLWAGHWDRHTHQGPQIHFLMKYGHGMKSVPWICACMHASVNVSICLPVSLCVCSYVCINICVVCLYVRRCVCSLRSDVYRCVYIHVCVCSCMCVCVCVRTHVCQTNGTGKEGRMNVK